MDEHMLSSNSTSEIERAGIIRIGPQRKCIITGQVADKAELIRFVASPDGELVADIGHKLGGRGVWVSAVRATLEKALSSNRLSRHLKQTVIINDDFLENLVQHLAKQVIARLSMMRKAGVLVTGGGKLRSQNLLSGLLIADDASLRETKRLVSLCKPDWIEKGIPSVWLGQISGSTSVAYAGVLGSTAAADRRLATMFRAELQRWRAAANTENMI